MAEKNDHDSAIFARLMQAHMSACPEARHSAVTLGEWCGIPAYKLRRIRRGESPLQYNELATIVRKTGLEMGWVSTGEGPVWQKGGASAPVEAPALIATPQQAPAWQAQPGWQPQESQEGFLPLGPCRQCAKMEKELEMERDERRDLTREVRELNRQNAELLRENGDLRARLASLEKFAREMAQPRQEAAQPPAGDDVVAG